MQLMIRALRSLPFVAGILLVLSALATLSGLAPESNGPVPLAARAISAFVPAVFGLVLLLPHRRFSASPRFQLLLLAHAAMAGILGLRLIQTVALVRTGELAPVAVLVALVFLALPVANGGALWWARGRGTPPNNSSKPTPLRGAA